MKIGTWFLKITIGVMFLMAVAIAIIPAPQIAIAVMSDAPKSLGFVGLMLIGGLYLVILGFLAAAWQAERLLLVIDRSDAFSRRSVKLLATIKWCVAVMAVGTLCWLPYLYVLVQQEDAPGLMFIGLCIIAVPIVVAVFLDVLQRLWAAALDYKEETDLTI